MKKRIDFFHPKLALNNKLKTCCQIEHHRYRSLWNFMMNLLSGLTAYYYDTEKQTFYLKEDDEKAMLVLAAKPPR